ncbi:MAG: CDP-alcohol phosphatidyltransferase, partial [Gammaproteobacteria bacterium]|nr:CDP-alcohol phosphatidyltransferase [Gammaproteobacteria bacterium]
VKIAAICTTISSLLLFLQFTPLPFRVAAVLCVLAGLEEILITLMLAQPRSNVRSLWHIWNEKQQH